MGRNEKTSAPPKTAQDKAHDKLKKPMVPADADDDFEDGDIATPKRDRTGSDDEPL